MYKKAVRLAGRCGLAMLAIHSVPSLPMEPTPVDLLTIANDALQHNAGYKAARAEYVAARELVPQATGKLLPQLGVKAQADWIDESIEGDYYGVVDVNRHDGFDRLLYSAVLKQALYQPELTIGRDQARLKLQQAGYALQQSQDELLMAACEAYFGVLATYDTVNFSQAELRAVSQQLDQIRVRTASGLATDADEKAALAQFELSSADLADAEIASSNAIDRLEAMTGRRYEKFRQLPPSVVTAPPDPQDETVWIERARLASLSVLQQKVAMTLAELDYERSRKLRWPTVDIVGNAFRLNNSGGATGGRDEDQQQIGVAMSVPLYTGGQISSAQRQALAMQDHARALHESALAQAVRDTRIAYRNTVSGQKRVSALARAVEAAAASEAAMFTGFEVGTKTSADVLNAVERRYAAESNYTAARYKVIINSLKLKQTSGSLLVADLARLNRLLAQ